MITVLGASALLLLTLSVVALFAMVGELAARVENVVSRLQDGALAPDGDWARLEDERAEYSVVKEWPTEIQPDAQLGYSLVVVLSSSCQSCTRFLSGELNDLDEFNPVFVISCPSADRADVFVQSHRRLQGRSVFRDVMGKWTREQLALEVSPAAMLMRGDRPVASFTMSSPSSLAAVVRDKIHSTEKVA